ncbi:hypothetical protein [Streptomyces sp. 900105755]
MPPARRHAAPDPSAGSWSKCCTGTITTLEGTTSDAFRRRVRGGACVVGNGGPAYDAAAPVPSQDDYRQVTAGGGTGPDTVSALDKQLRNNKKARSRAT